MRIHSTTTYRSTRTTLTATSSTVCFIALALRQCTFVADTFLPLSGFGSSHDYDCDGFYGHDSFEKCQVLVRDHRFSPLPIGLEQDVEHRRPSRSFVMRQDTEPDAFK